MVGDWLSTRSPILRALTTNSATNKIAAGRSRERPLLASRIAAPRARRARAQPACSPLPIFESQESVCSTGVSPPVFNKATAS